MLKSSIRFFNSISKPAEFFQAYRGNHTRDRPSPKSGNLPGSFGLIFLLLFPPSLWSSEKNQLPALRSGSFLNQAFSKSGSHSEVPELSIFAEFDQFKVDPGARLSLQMRVLIPEGWHLYSIHGSDDGDYIPTRLEAFSKVHQLNGPLREKTPILEWDAVLEKEVLLHRKELLLEQDFQISPEASAGIQDFEGELEFQACNNSICVPLSRQPFTAALEIRS